ncbi:MAG: sigma 54-interacting transcriptional regulator [Deltaproteobacteria bacterium]|jgi:two-component system response regulator HydG|nr:sigma 54-interacting transcriptional regulator [Deltaproteobacteria bacterium]
MRPRSLKSKLLIIVSLLVIGSGLLISLLVTHRYGQSLFESMTAHAENVAQAIALDATDKILTNDLVALQKMLDYHITSTPHTAYIFIIRENQVLAHTFPRGMPLDLIGANDVILNNFSHHKEIISTDGQRYLDIAWAIFAGKAGTLRLGVYEKPFRDQVMQLWLQMSALTLSILLLAIGGSLFFIRRVTRPLTALATAAEAIGEERLDFDLNIPLDSEVGRLALSFNKMLGRIREYTRNLEEKNRQLDRAHHQTRTSFLISQEINALTTLNEVCAYLVKKLQSIVTCNDMAVVVFNSGSSTLFCFSGRDCAAWPEENSRMAYELLAELEETTFIESNREKMVFLPEPYEAAERMVAFPLRHEGQFLGAMLVACPGGCNCVTKDLDIIEIILAQSTGAIRRAIAHEDEIRELRTRIETSSGFSGLIGKDPQMQVIYKLIEDVAPTEATVLIQGESGTGKELVARAIHTNSLRKGSPFVVINCSAYPATLLESELFGHEKGAFTGAVRQKAGRFEKADGGTVFLDEIGEISPTAQIKLLRILQSRKFERVGGEKTLAVNARILAATNKDLQQEVKTGNFREDLFYRLNVIPIQVPPLRDRRNDIPLLARHFLKEFSAEQNKPVQRFSPEAMRLLLDYDWPGNVRELENSIEHATVIVKGQVVEVSELPAAIQQARPRPTISKLPEGSDRSITENEKTLLREVLDECNWNKKETAAKLGISRSTLYEKLKKYNITRPTVH